MDASLSLPDRSAEKRAGFLLIEAIDRLSELTGSLATLAILTMMSIVCWAVFSRYVLGEPTSWVTEIATYVLVGMVFVGLAAAQKSGSHIQVELVANALPAPLREAVDITANWIGLFFAVFATWQMIVFNGQEYVHDTRDWGLLGTPQWLPELAVSIGYVAFSLAIVADICRARPPATRRAAWVLPATALALSAVLVALGTRHASIAGTRFDWGSVAIVVAFLVAMPAWSGLRIAAAATASVAALAALFWWAHAFSLLAIGMLLIAALLFLLLLGVRIALALGIVGMMGLYFLLPLPQLSLLAERSWSSVNSFTLTAVPMFVLMGGFLWQSGVTTDMFDALVRWFGRTPGGLAHASVGASAIFAAVSGSSVATAATLGAVACPEMVRRGYSARLTYGVVAAGATLGIMIPPSIPMIIYGSTVGANVTVLCIAGIVPGLILMLGFMAGVLVWSIAAPGASPAGQRYSIGAKLRGSTGMVPFSLVIVAVLGSLYAGIATPTEAGAIGAAASMLLCLQRGKLGWTTLYGTALEAARITSFLLLIVVGASILSWACDYLRLPRTLVATIEAAGLAPWVVMTVIAGIYLVLGMFIDSISMMLMTLPVAYPIVASLGFDAIWFGIFLVVMIEVGLVTPPVGMVLFVLRGFSGQVKLKEIALGVLPFIAIILSFVVLMYAFPEIVHWLPDRVE
jgi:tripartite ATP-independent transporter DctM subunit